MAQVRYWQYKDDDKTDTLNRYDMGAVPSGVWAGFDFDGTSSGTNLVLSHTASGYKEVTQALAESSAIGVIKTRQGVMVTEDSIITIPVTTNSGGGNPRVDIIALQHEYTAVTGGTVATYVHIAGTAAASPLPPALTLPLKQTIIGYIYWATGGNDVAAVKYSKSTLQLAKRDIKLLSNLSFNAGIAAYSASTGCITLDGKGNYYELDVDFAIMSGGANITGISSYAVAEAYDHFYWDGINNRTKAGNIVFIRFKNTSASSVGYAKVLHNSSVPDPFSPIDTGMGGTQLIMSGATVAFIESYESGNIIYKILSIYPGLGELYTLGINPAPSYTATWSGGVAAPLSNIQYRLDIDGRVHMSGIAVRSSGAGTTVFTLPSEFRPVRDKFLSVMTENNSTTGGTFTFMPIKVAASTGVVSILHAITNQDQLYFDDVAFSIFD